MKRVKINIPKSDRNLKYNIFRSTDNSIHNIETLADKTPIAIILDETIVSSSIAENKLIEDYGEIRNDNKIKFHFKDNIIPSSTNDILITIYYIDNTTCTLKFIFDDYKNITKIIVTKNLIVTELLLASEIDSFGLSLIDKTILIDKSYLNSYVDIKYKTKIDVILFNDYNNNPSNVTYIGPPAHGLPKPSINNTIKLFNDGSRNTPYLLLEQNIKENYYYYSIVGEDALGNITMPCKAALSLKEDNDNFTGELYVSDNYCLNKDTATWGLLKNNFTIADDLYILDNNSSFINSKIYNNNKTKVLDTDITVSNKYLENLGILEIKIPNVWSNVNYKKYKEKYPNAFKVRYTSAINDISEYSDIISPENIEVSIDRIIVAKKKVTLDSVKDTPLDITQNDVKIIKNYIRKEGVFYNNYEEENYPQNVYTSNEVINIIQEKTLFGYFIIEDDDIVIGQDYNYTFTFIDANRDVIHQIVKVVNC